MFQTYLIATANYIINKIFVINQTTAITNNQSKTDAIVFFAICLDVLEDNKKGSPMATAYIL
ncbi:MAG: hypothetical protein J6Q51_02070 [Clostridia bacterium]|nr:hypothetical protein [Clostridia bacterium]